jgi:hypothetical protein
MIGCLCHKSLLVSVFVGFGCWSSVVSCWLLLALVFGHLLSVVGVGVGVGVSSYHILYYCINCIVCSHSGQKSHPLT